MKELQLYIEGQRVDLFKDESITLTETVKNIRDIDKVFTSFSQTFTVPASKTNNKIFKHYYDFNVVGFDARLKVDASILINSIPYTNGKIQLTGVELKNNKPYSYKIVFYGLTVEINDLIGEDKLNLLSTLNDFSFDYTFTNIRNKLGGDRANTKVLVPLITHTQRLFYDSGSHTNQTGNIKHDFGEGHRHGVRWDNLKPAIRLRTILDAIEERYDGITFADGGFFDATNEEFNALYMWLHRKEGYVEPDEQITTFTTPLDFDTETQNAFVSFYYGLGTFNIDGSYVSGWDLSLVTTSTETYDFVITDEDNQQEVFRANGLTGSNYFDETDYVFGDGTYSFKVVHQNNFTFNSLNFVVRDNTLPTPLEDTYSISSYFVEAVIDFVITDQIPDIKIIDFLSNLFKMFNLIAYVNDDGEIEVQKYNTYYSVGQADDAFVRHDVSEYTDTSTMSVSPALPFREVDLSYKDTKTLLANQHNEVFGAEWGNENYREERGYNAEIYKVELPFSHFKFERLIDLGTNTYTTIQWGYSVDSKQEAYKGEPLIFYPVKTLCTNNGISIIDEIDQDGNFVSHVKSSPRINMPSNSLEFDPLTSKVNLNFKNEVNEYTRTTEFTDTLFEQHYKSYIQGTFDLKNRLITVKANLPDRILFNIELNHRIVLNTNLYRINSMKTNLMTNETTFELLPELMERIPN